uniref:polynucleotide adenylyltransferase n=1 Tax=Alexandrium monilatum TaxID=311494 RepID=A0A7S4SMN9_9DINO
MGPGWEGLGPQGPGAQGPAGGFEQPGLGGAVPGLPHTVLAQGLGSGYEQPGFVGAGQGGGYEQPGLVGAVPGLPHGALPPGPVQANHMKQSAMQHGPTMASSMREQNMPQNFPQGMPQSMVQGMQHGMGQGMQPGMQPGPQGLQQARSQGMQQGMSQGMQQNLAQGMQQSLAQEMQPSRSQRMQQGPPQTMPQGMFEGMQQGMPQGMSHGLQGMQQGMPQGGQQGMPQGMRSSMAQGMQNQFVGMHDNLPHGGVQQNAQGMQQSMHQGMQPNMPTGMSQNLSPGMAQVAQNLPPGMQQNVPQGMQQNVPQGMQQGVPPGMQPNVAQSMLDRLQGMSQNPNSLQQGMAQGMGQGYGGMLPGMPPGQNGSAQGMAPSRSNEGKFGGMQQNQMPPSRQQSMQQGMGQSMLQGMQQGSQQGHVPGGYGGPQQPHGGQQQPHGGQQSSRGGPQQPAATSAPEAPTPQMAAGKARPPAPAHRQSKSSLAVTSDGSAHNGKERTLSGRGVTFVEANGWAPGDDQPNPANPDGTGSSGTGTKAVLNSEHLLEELEMLSPSMPPNRAAHIEEVLAQIQSACQACVYTAAAAAGRSEPNMESEQLLPLGAYHLGVMCPDDEVDVLFVVPLVIQLSNFTAMLRHQLEQMADSQPIRTAPSDGLLTAPGLCFAMGGVDVTLLLAQRVPNLPLPTSQSIVPNTAGLLAREASERILSQTSKAKHFRHLLRFVRYWARQRGIFGSFIGFLGGMSWAICVARVCQSNPQLELAQLTACFFQVLSRWDWRQPVARLGSGAAPDTLALAAANSALTESGEGISPGQPNMTVMLPVEGVVPAAPYLSETTAKFVHKELRRGYKMMQHMQISRPLSNDAHPGNQSHWCDLYAPARFFNRHRHYLEFDFMATSPDVFVGWLTWGREQLKDLVHLFESNCSKLVTLRPWPEFITFKDASWPHACALFVGLHLNRSMDQGAEGVRRLFDLREPIVRLLGTISKWPEADKHENKFELLIRHVRLAELEEWLDNQSKGIVTNRSGAADQENSHSWQRSKGGGGGPSQAWTITEDAEDAAGGMVECSF